MEADCTQLAGQTFAFFRGLRECKDSEHHSHSLRYTHLAVLVEIPFGKLSSDALDGVIEEFVSREGTDYGERAFSMTDKKALVRTQLERGSARLIFDPETESCNIVTREELAALRQGEE